MTYQEILAKFDDPMGYVAWQQEVGSDEAQAMVEKACLELMEAEGTRAILPVVEKMKDCEARLAEFY